MKCKFVIEDELHADCLGEFPKMEEAMAELRRLASIPWDHEPNTAPCSNWEKCGRSYQVIEYDTDSEPWMEIRRKTMLHISANSIRWTPAAHYVATQLKIDKMALKDNYTRKFSEVRKVLMNEWDPIGAGVPDDEYDSYVNQILSMPKEEVTSDSLTSYLMMVQNELMGLPPNEAKDRGVAIKLVEVLQS